jgi:alkylation response protein AidB-like acyl-CoA dehydrogenase
MNLDFTAAEEEFRQEVRAFFTENVTEELRAIVRTGMRPDPHVIQAWQRRMHARGWGAPTWPVEYGGTGWTPTQYYIYETEAARAYAPPQPHQGLELIGPIIFTYGSPEQKAKYLPRIVAGDAWWCQGYSEPGAGSDLASLKTRAVRDGNHWVVNGQKIWTSYAQAATNIFCLVRTEVKSRKQEGISLLLIDMDTPGIRVRPIITLDERHHVNEVFLDDVRVPAENLVGEEGKGWGYGKVLLDRERGISAAGGLRLAQFVRVVKDRAAAVKASGSPLLAQPAFRAKLAQLEIEMLALEGMSLRTLADTEAGVDSGPRGSMLKIRWSELIQRITALWAAALGTDAALMEPLGGVEAAADMPHAMAAYLHMRVTTIYGGANEVQRNIIARRALGL